MSEATLEAIKGNRNSSKDVEYSTIEEEMTPNSTKVDMTSANHVELGLNTNNSGNEMVNPGNYFTLEKPLQRTDTDTHALPNSKQAGLSYELAKPVNMSEYGVAKEHVDKEECEDYDHLEHLSAHQNPREEHDSFDTYAHAHTTGDDNNDIYTHAQNGQFPHKDKFKSGKSEQDEDTYEHAGHIPSDDHDTYDHSDTFATEVKGESSDYAYAHAQNSSADEDDYDHAG